MEAFLQQFDLPVLAYLRDSQIYPNAAFNGMSIFDLPRLTWPPANRSTGSQSLIGCGWMRIDRPRAARSQSELTMPAQGL